MTGADPMFQDPDARPRGRFRPLLLIVSGIVLAILINAGALGALLYGLATPQHTFAGPGTETIDSPPGTYVWARTDTADPDRPRPTVAADAPHATVTLSPVGEWMAINSNRYEVLARIEITQDAPTDVTLAGQPDAFPVMLFRDQKSWVSMIGLVFVIAMALPLLLVFAGIGLWLRDRHRRNEALMNQMDTIR